MQPRPHVADSQDCFRSAAPLSSASGQRFGHHVQTVLSPACGTPRLTSNLRSRRSFVLRYLCGIQRNDYQRCPRHTIALRPSAKHRPAHTSNGAPHPCTRPLFQARHHAPQSTVRRLSTPVRRRAALRIYRSEGTSHAFALDAAHIPASFVASPCADFVSLHLARCAAPRPQLLAHCQSAQTDAIPHARALPMLRHADRASGQTPCVGEDSTPRRGAHVCEDGDARMGKAVRTRGQLSFDRSGDRTRRRSASRRAGRRAA